MDSRIYPSLTGRSPRPLLLVDVDGVISLFGFGSRPPERTVGALVDGIPHVLSTEAAGALQGLAATFECVWCTGWEEKAGEHLPYLLGLPRGWPFVPLTPAGARSLGAGSVAGHWKLGPIDAYAGRERALAWIDDAFDDACRAWAAARPGATLLVDVDPAVGLTGAHAAAIAAWAAGQS